MEKKCRSDCLIDTKVGKEDKIVLHNGKVEKSSSCFEDSYKRDKVNGVKDVSCQTEFDVVLHQHLLKLEGEMETEQERMEKEYTEEQNTLESNLRQELNHVIKAKDDLIQVLTEEKDFLWSELRDLKKSFDLFTRYVHRDALQILEWNNEGLGLKTGMDKTDFGKSGNYRYGNSYRKSEELLLVLRKQEENMLRSFEWEKAEMTQRFEREKVALKRLVEKECQSQFAYEKSYLLQSVEGLKEGLDSLKVQKNELAKIFEGEKNALELSFKRKEEELKRNLRLDLQRKLIQAQKPWAQSKV